MLFVWPIGFYLSSFRKNVSGRWSWVLLGGGFSGFSFCSNFDGSCWTFAGLCWHGIGFFRLFSLFFCSWRLCHCFVNSYEGLM